MKKIASSILFISAMLVACEKNKNNDKYFYNPLRDVLAPEIKTSVPIPLDLYSYGDDIFMIGTVTDLESENKAGKLKSFQIIVDHLDPSTNTVIKRLATKNPVVDGKDGVGFKEKFTVASGTGSMYCRYVAEARDYADRIDRDSIYFYIQ